MFRLTQTFLLCISSTQLEPTIVIPNGLIFGVSRPQGSNTLIDFYTPDGEMHAYGNIELGEGITYVQMNTLTSLPKFGVAVPKWEYGNYSFQIDIAPIINEFSLDESEVGNLNEIEEMIFSTKSKDDLHFCLKLAIPILHKYNFHDLFTFQCIYNERYLRIG